MCHKCGYTKKHKTVLFKEDSQWKVPRGVKNIEVTLIGGGGGGAGGFSGDAVGGGGGGSGYIVSNYVLEVNKCDNVNVTVGSGGEGGLPDANGSDGDSSVVEVDGVKVSAFGGKGGFNGPPANGGDGYYGGGAGSAPKDAALGGNGIAPPFNGGNSVNIGKGGDGASGGEGFVGGGGGGPGGGNGGSLLEDGQPGKPCTGSGGGGGGSAGSSLSEGKGGNGGSGLVTIKYVRHKCGCHC